MAETTPVFSLGVAAPSKKRKSKKPLPAAAAPTMHDPLQTPIYRFTRYPWFLTNPAGCIALLAITQAVDPDTKKEYTSIAPILNFLRQEFHRQKTWYPSRIKFPVSYEQTLAGISEAIRHVKNNQRQLMAFRALAHRWLLKRRFKAANEEDLMTGEAPKKPITLVAWSERRKYVFEANTIRRDMLERLFQQSYLFPKYLTPRNPFTNCDMTANQFTSVMNQLRSYGSTHWALEGLLKCRYDMENFRAAFGESMKREVIARQFSNPSSSDTIDIILHFMEDQHEDNDKYCNVALYRWALENRMNHPKIKKWIALCRRYHECLLKNINDRLAQGKDILDINDKCAKLCEYPIDLEDLRNADLKKKGLPPITLTAPEPQLLPEVEFEDTFILQFTFLHIDNETATASGGETPPTDTDTAYIRPEIIPALRIFHG